MQKEAYVLPPTGVPQEQTHTISCDLSPWSNNTKARWSFAPRGTGVVFIHGFNGTSTGTWREFPALLPFSKECIGCDLIFFGYDGLRTQANVSAVLLYDFLDTLLTDPLRVINSSIHPKAKRPNGFAYDRIVLVAHSLGSIVCRRALLNAHDSGKPWVDKTQMVLFAPAHLGARIAPLVLSAMTPIQWVTLGLAKPVLRFKSPLIDDLSPRSSTLTSLLDDTKAVIKSGNGSFAIARTVIWGERDNVIKAERFASDPVAIVYPGKNHIEVCKPTRRFTTPIAHVIEAL